jgi:chromatin remodeling complex protein RSC6
MARAKKSVKSAPVESATPAENTVVEAAAPESAEPSLADAFGELLSSLTAMRSQITSLSAQVRSLRSRSEREVKAAQKAGRKRRSTNRKPSGFVKPTLISAELAGFLGKPEGTEMARTEVTREINQYVRAHKLQDPSNRRRILADTKLRKLLKLKKSDELTYFNLQKYMSCHFAKAGQPAPAAQ